MSTSPASSDRARGHAGPLPDRPLRGRLGRLQPDPHRRGVRPGRSACPAGSCTACGPWPRWRAHTPRPPAGRSSSSASRSSSAAWGVLEREDHGHGHRRARSTDGVATVSSKAEQAGEPDHPERGGRANGGGRWQYHCRNCRRHFEHFELAWRRTRRRWGVDRRETGRVAPGATGTRSGPTYNLAPVLTERQELVLRKVVEEYLEAGAPVGSKALAAGSEWGPSTIRHELAQPRGARAARPSAHLGRPGARPRPATATSSTGCCPTTTATPPLALSLVRREIDEAMRVDDRDALAGDQPAGDRHRAADRDLDDPPHRGAGAPAPGADGRRDHLDRRRDQAAVHLRAARSTRARRLGGELPERAPRRARARRADAPPAPARPVAARSTEAAFLDALPPAFTELEEAAAGHAVRRGHRAAAAARALRRRLASSTR